MATKRMRLFAGPNGSGKTTLIEEVSELVDIGCLVNADKIESEINRKMLLDCSEYLSTEQSQEDWDFFLHSMRADSRLDFLDLNDVALKENFIVVQKKIDSYCASIIAEFLRGKLLLEDKTFSFETVMSHESKIAFLKEAKRKGFKTYLYFVCTQDSQINESRVRNRVKEGGHTVLQKKIRSRYQRTLELLCSAFLIADRTYILDNSGAERQLIVEKKMDEVVVYGKVVPEWVAVYLLDKLNL